MIKKPMLAVECEKDRLDFSNEYLATPKIDGIRAMMIDD